jgi:hypothetical protein
MNLSMGQQSEESASKEAEQSRLTMRRRTAGPASLGSGTGRIKAKKSFAG